ncbi:MAG: hypothetical protein FGM50_12445, partial [Mycobacterium sp.]|nr:hypothetical protein [Mycobacterium sp.]
MSNVLQPESRHRCVPHVMPVADYEPPAVGGPLVLPAVPRALPRTRRRPPCPAPVVLHRGDTSGGQGDARGDAARAAATFADAALRRVLEVIDQRRGRAHLRGLLAPSLVDSMPAPRRCVSGAARLRRFRALPVDATGTAAEVAASYTRGERVHAIACRVERR